MNKKSPISVRTGSSSYPVIFGDFRRTLKRYLGEADKIVVISNATVYALHGDRFVREFLPGNKKIIPLMIGDGEKYKSQATVNLIYEHLFDIGLERRDAVAALGGGVVGDVAGFAAATYKRGVSLIQAPTTLLSMVDSSIGGKTGVNHRQGKNLIGTFYQPRMTLINPIWLATLGSREMIDGLAEIIKTGFISSKKLLMEAAAMEPVYVSGDRDR
jgi:3-dehydroquinate synthetase